MEGPKKADVTSLIAQTDPPQLPICCWERRPPPLERDITLFSTMRGSDTIRCDRAM